LRICYGSRLPRCFILSPFWAELLCTRGLRISRSAFSLNNRSLAKTKMSKIAVKSTLPVNPPLKFLRTSVFLLLPLSTAAATLAQENPPPSFETRVAPGVEALKSGDLDTAEKIFSSALRQGIKHPLVYHNLGVIAQQRSQHVEAVARFRQALALEPDFGPSHLLLGSSLLALGKNAEAVRELQHAVKLMPQQPQAHLQLAEAYESSENWIAAVQQLRKLVELAPQEPEYSYQLGKAWTKLSGWSYQQISRVDPHSARLQQALGQEYAVQEKYDLALVAFQKAAQSDPKLPEIHLAIALICLELKRFDEAVAAIEIELRLVPESKSALDAKAKVEAAKIAASP
jgi:tetratricopeptide (TPR) repeat protein